MEEEKKETRNVEIGPYGFCFQTDRIGFYFFFASRSVIEWLDSSRSAQGLICIAYLSLCLYLLSSLSEAHSEAGFFLSIPRMLCLEGNNMFGCQRKYIITSVDENSEKSKGPPILYIVCFPSTFTNSDYSILDISQIDHLIFFF